MTPLAALEARLGPERAALLGQFLRFGVVGTVGFLVDTATLYAALAAGLGLYWGRALSYVVAATGNWALNRVWTFRGRNAGPAHRQWAMFLLTNLGGFALNYGTYAILVASWPLAARHPVIAVAAGSLAGMLANFAASRALVFRPAP